MPTVATALWQVALSYNAAVCMAIESNMKDPSFGANNIYTVRQKKGTTFLLQINLLICNVI